MAWRTGQLREDGFSDRAVRRLVDCGDLVRIRQGCYVRGTYWTGLSESSRQRQRIVLHNFGTLNTAKQGFVYSHLSAARLHGLHLWDVDTFIHVTSPRTPSSVGSGPDTKIHRRALADADTILIGRLRATTLERTVIDCCLTLRYKQALILTDHALRMGASKAQLLAAADELGTHRGIRTLRKVLTNADARSESPGETLTRDLIRELRIEAPRLQVWIATTEGPARVDFAWPDRKVILEFDGKAKYFDYRPTDEAVFQERKREVALVEAGWTVLRIQWKDLFDEAGFTSRVPAALSR